MGEYGEMNAEQARIKSMINSRIWESICNATERGEFKVESRLTGTEITYLQVLGYSVKDRTDILAKEFGIFEISW